MSGDASPRWFLRRTVRLLTTRGGLSALFALSVTAIVCACFPLADHIGFELAMALTIVSALVTPLVGVAAIRRERLLELSAQRFGWAALSAGLVGLVGVLGAVGIIVLNGLRRPSCEPFAGAVWLVLLPVPTTFLAGALGAFAQARSSTTKRAAAWIVLIETGTLLWSLSSLYWGPSFFLFDHLFGYFPGPLYDEVIVTSSAIVLFRGLTLLWALTAAIAASASPLTGAPRRKRLAWAVILALSCVGVSARWGPTIGFRSTDAQIADVLGGKRLIDHLEVHYPREWPDKMVEQFLHDAAFRASQVEAALGITPTHTVRVWLYRSAEEKRRLVGASGTSFAKPWRHEIHINASAFPHPVIRHELVHAFAAETCPGAFNVPGGLFPNTPLIEGFAVAFDQENDGMTLMHWAKAMRAAHLAPNIPALLSESGFFATSPARAYSYAGAFIRFLIERFGKAKVLELYASNDLSRLGDPNALVADFERSLDALPISASEKAMAERRYSRPSVFHRQCAREVGQVSDEAQELISQGRNEEALARLDQVCSIEPDDPALLRSLLSVEIRLKDTARRDATLQKILAHPKLDPSLRAATLSDLGDEAWRTDRLDEAAKFYTEAAVLPVDAATHRSAVARLEAVRSPDRAKILKPLLVEGNAEVGQLFKMNSFLAAHPTDGLVEYLLARQLTQRDALELALPMLASAREHGLTDPEILREALRMTARASAERHECAAAADVAHSLTAVASSQSDRQFVDDWAERCRFEVERGWPIH
jgi:tetratricopeptide (TPR) repeat protein